jgi:hypothetical protein
VAENERTKLTTWCCIDQGENSLTAVFEKNQYHAKETAKAMVQIDNS